MHPQLGSGADGTSIHQIVEDLLGERIEALASWIQELDAQVRATSAASDEKALKELRKALEAWSKRDPKFEERLTERVDVLADRLATLSSTVSTATAARASSEGEIAALRREVEQETAKLNRAMRELGATDATHELQELRRAVSDLGRAPRATAETTSATREDFQNIGARVDMLAKTVATTANGLAGREGDLASLRRSLGEANSRIEEIAASLPRTSDDSRVARLESRLAELTKTVDDANGVIVERERLTASLRSGVEEQGSKLEALATAVRESTRAFEARLAEIAERNDGAALTELDTRVASLADRLGATEPRFDELHAQLDSLSSQLVHVSAERAGGADEIAALRRQVDESGTLFEAAIADLRGLIAAVPTGPSDAELETRLTPLQTRLDGLAGQVRESEARFEDALAEVRRAVEELPTGPSLDDLDTRLAPVETQLEGLAARVVEADGRIAERLERETSRASGLEKRLEELRTYLEEVTQRLETAAVDYDATKSAAELERAWVREQMDAVVSAVADTASRADVEPLIAALERRLGELAGEQAALTAEIGRTRENVLEETVRLDAQLRALPEAPVLPDLEPLVNDLTRRVEEIAAEQSLRAAELTTAHDTMRATVERLETEVSELAEPSTSEGELEPLVSELKRRLEELAGEQSSRAAALSSAHESLRSQLERVEADVRELPESSAAIPPSEDEQLERLLTAFADRIDAMEQERPTIADEAAEAAQSRVDQVQPLVEGLRRRLDETDRRLEALGPPEGLGVTLEELAERIHALEARPVAPPQPAPLPGDGRFRVELRALELRMQHAEAAARENREAVLVQLERLASRIEWRLQRLESDEQTEPEGSQEEPPLGQVVPLRGGAENT